MGMNHFLFWFLCTIYGALFTRAYVFYDLPRTDRDFTNIRWTGWITLDILHWRASIPRGIVEILMIFIIKISNNSLECVIIWWLTHTCIFVISTRFPSTLCRNIDGHQMFTIPRKLISINSFQNTFRIWWIFIFLLRAICCRLWLGLLFFAGYL